MSSKLNFYALFAIGTIIFLILSRTSNAGGLYISEFGTPSMGVAEAGAQAVASDASTSFHNPAGMTRIKGKELKGTGGFIYSTVKFDKDADTPIDGGNGGDGAESRLCWEAFMSTASTTAGNWAPTSYP